MKIYVITKGHYSDYHIVCATTDKATAEKLQKMYTNKTDDYYKANIEEFEDKELNKGLNLYNCYYCVGDKNCTIKLCEYEEGQIGNIYCYNNNVDKWYSLITYAKDEEHATKIFQDKIAEHKAKKEGLI